MHRHGYKGRKLHRQSDQRRALIKGLADSLVMKESIETTLPKAKEILPYLEKLITKAKKGDLHNRRQVISGLATQQSAHKLVDEIAPKLKQRQSGYLKIEKTGTRRGDHAPLAKISFVDDLKDTAKAKPAETLKTAAKVSAKPAAKKSTAKTKPKPETKS